MFVCVVSLSQPSSRDLFVMLNVFVCCLVISAQVVEICYMLNLLYVKCLCVVSLSQPCSRDLLYVEICYKCYVCVFSRYPSPVERSAIC